jgi:hypothetical protein
MIMTICLICLKLWKLEYYNHPLEIGICSSCKKSNNISIIKLLNYHIHIQALNTCNDLLEYLDIYTSNIAFVYMTQVKYKQEVIIFNTIISKMFFNEINSHTN